MNKFTKRLLYISVIAGSCFNFTVNEISGLVRRKTAQDVVPVNLEQIFYEQMAHNTGFSEPPISSFKK